MGRGDSNSSNQGITQNHPGSIKKALLIVPACETGRGGGHLSRCVTLARDLRAAGREAWLYAPDESGKTDSLLQSMDFNPAWRITCAQEACAKTVECIVLDRFQTPAEEFLRWKQIAPVIGIDEGGSCRDRFDFLIDILVPEKLGRPAANIVDPSLLPLCLCEKIKTRPAAPFKVLVSFGQEDGAGLGITVSRTLSAEKSNRKMDITLLRGTLAKEEFPSLPGVRILESIPALAERLGGYDLVITHYGITAYEALHAGTPVLLAHPTPYHKKLAKAAGFSTFMPHGFLRIDEQFLEKLHKKCAVLAEKYNLDHAPRSLAELINSIAPHVSCNCPACGAESVRGVFRYIDRTYRRCPKCGIIYMDRAGPPPVEYGREYFFDLYRKQYGKTYIEDFPNLTAMAKRRLKIIKGIIPQVERELPLFDIGCAYGPFLAAAREEGFSPCGIDPSEDAVRYVTGTLGIPAVQGYFPHNGLLPRSSPSAPCSVITLWYVIEHFRDCVPVLAEIRKLLKPGGVLAFATPSSAGISGRTSLRDFLQRSPADHWTVWSPAVCKKALRTAGFKVKKIANCGHHPERFPLAGKFARSRKSPLYWLLLTASKVFTLGDTIEVYAVKETT